MKGTYNNNVLRFYTNNPKSLPKNIQNENIENGYYGPSSKNVFGQYAGIPKKQSNKKYIININKMDVLKDITNNQPESPITVSDVDLLNDEFHEPIECEHNIIHDYIDITPDKSMQIKYCDKCMMTFS
jgi:hypothetical protein